jgi:hypothetical protein
LSYDPKQISLLNPSAIIALGVGTYHEFRLRYKGAASHFRVQRSRGDTYLPDEGRRDIEAIAARLNRNTGTVLGLTSVTTEPRHSAQLQRKGVPNNLARSSRFGSYEIVDPNAILKRASKRNDPRWAFYDAMMKLSNYEDYYAKFGDMKVYPQTYRSSPRTGQTEMAWARKQGWVADA